MDLLLAAAFDHLAEEFDRIWRARVARAGGAPWERLGAMIEAYFAPEVFSSEKLAVWFSFWVDADLRDEFRAASVKVERRYHRELEPEIVHLLEAARVPETEKEAARITGMLTAMVDGYWLQALLYPKDFARRRRWLPASTSCTSRIGSEGSQPPKLNRSASGSLSPHKVRCMTCAAIALNVIHVTAEAEHGVTVRVGAGLGPIKGNPVGLEPKLPHQAWTGDASSFGIRRFSFFSMATIFFRQQAVALFLVGNSSSSPPTITRPSALVWRRDRGRPPPRSGNGLGQRFSFWMRVA